MVTLHNFQIKISSHLQPKHSVYNLYSLERCSRLCVVQRHSCFQHSKAAHQARKVAQDMSEELQKLAALSLILLPGLFCFLDWSPKVISACCGILAFKLFEQTQPVYRIQQGKQRRTCQRNCKNRLLCPSLDFSLCPACFRISDRCPKRQGAFSLVHKSNFCVFWFK